jgi:ABC-type bacteriocin/lantibiotic exporter with double-glycine peptidase domain
LGWLRSNIGYVQQTPFVFSGSYKDNIRYGKLNASDEEIVAAAKLVGIHDFIMASQKATTPSSKMAAARSPKARNSWFPSPAPSSGTPRS